MRQEMRYSKRETGIDSRGEGGEYLERPIWMNVAGTTTFWLLFSCMCLSAPSVGDGVNLAEGTSWPKEPPEGEGGARSTRKVHRRGILTHAKQQTNKQTNKQTNQRKKEKKKEKRKKKDR